MQPRIAKEFLHLDSWLDQVDQIAELGRQRCLTDNLPQEAGDSLMMKLGEAANRLAHHGVPSAGEVE